MAGSPAATLLGITAFLFIVLFLLFGGRIHGRVKERRFRWDDYSITLATILALIEWCLVIVAATQGMNDNMGPSSRNLWTGAHHLLFTSELLWIPTIALIRIGIAFTVLHFKQERPWRITLSLLIAAQVLFCIINLVFMIVQCVPMQYVWNEATHRDAVCTTSNSVLTSQYVHAGIGTGTDLILALTPLSFAQPNALPSRHGILALFLVVLGLFATAGSTLRITLLKAHATSPDSTRTAAQITLWALLEVQTALIAANIAAFKRIPPPPPPPSHHYASSRRRHRNPNSRRASSLTYTDSYQLPSLHLSLSQSHKHSLGVDTNVSSLTGSSTLGRSRSEEIIWPREYKTSEESEGERHDSAFQHMMAAGGILMTRELDVRSEVLSRVGSSDGERMCGEHVRREEWAIAEGEGQRVRGDWSAV